MMKRYIENLRTSSDEANLRREEEAKAKSQSADTRVLCDKSLTEQIETLMRSLPPVQRDRFWNMEEMCLRLKGKFSASPHPMNVGQALRALGWMRRRDYSALGRGQRYWYPPEEP
jgi:hypothetical protein